MGGWLSRRQRLVARDCWLPADSCSSAISIARVTLSPLREFSCISLINVSERAISGQLARPRTREHFRVCAGTTSRRDAHSRQEPGLCAFVAERGEGHMRCGGERGRAHAGPRIQAGCTGRGAHDGDAQRALEALRLHCSRIAAWPGTNVCAGRDGCSSGSRLGVHRLLGPLIDGDGVRKARLAGRGATGSFSCDVAGHDRDQADCPREAHGRRCSGVWNGCACGCQGGNRVVADPRCGGRLARSVEPRGRLWCICESCAAAASARKVGRRAEGGGVTSRKQAARRCARRYVGRSGAMRRGHGGCLGHIRRLPGRRSLTRRVSAYHASAARRRFGTWRSLGLRRLWCPRYRCPSRPRARLGRQLPPRERCERRRAPGIRRSCER